MSDLEDSEKERKPVVQNEFIAKEADEDLDDELDEDEEDKDDSKIIDSSDEDEDEDEDGEAARKVREGFIVDDDEDEDEDEDEDVDQSSKHKKKHRRHKKRERVRDDEDELDEDDLELLRENAGALPPHLASKSKFKRLKRGGDNSDDEEDDVDSSGRNRRLTDMFSDEEGNDEDENEGASRGRRQDYSDDENEDEDDLLEESRIRQKNREQNNQQRQDQQQNRNVDEFEDFIEDDEFSDDEEDKDEKLARMRSVKANVNKNFAATSQIDQDKLDELYEIFGDGDDYAWALEAEEEEDEEQQDGYDQDAEEDEYDEEGNLISKGSSSTSRNKEQPGLKDIFEFAELKSHLLTESDTKIKTTDIPERYQKLRENIENYDLEDEDFELKQNWISNALYEEKISMFSNDKQWLIEPFQKSVAQIVYFIAKDNLEVPVIWSCRKDYTLHTYKENGQLRVQKLLNENDLWRIVQLDIKFHAIFNKKNSIEKIFKTLNVTDSLYDEYIKNFKNSVDLQDIQDYVFFTYSSELKSKSKTDDLTKKTKTKTHSKYSYFERIKSDKVYSIIEKLGIDSNKFGENVSANQRIYLTDDDEENPNDLINKIIKENVEKNPNSYFNTIENCKNAIKNYFAHQLINNPKLRSTLRLAFQNYANIDVKLTEKGYVKITDDSPYADFKYAINRLPESFKYEPNLFLRMLEAETLGYINIQIGLKNALENFKNHLLSFLSSDGTSEISNEWNKLRKESLDIALNKLIPMVSLDVKEQIRETSERLLFFEVRSKFMDKLDQAPYHPFFNNGTVPKVLSISNGDGKNDAAVIAVAVDFDGTILEHYKFENNYRHPDFTIQLLNLIRRFKPEVVAISGYTVATNNLYHKIVSVIKENKINVVVDENEYEDTPKDIELPVIWVPNETARLYEHSQKANEEFSDRTTVAKFCIGIARYVQSPLLEYINLDESILSVSIHKNQNLLSNDRLNEAIESIFVDVSCLVGIKINDAVRSPYLSSMLNYIAGLGPNKALSLIKGIEVNGGSLLKREDLILKGLTTKNVFMNCSPFLEIPLPSRYDKETEPLDATRIHPEDYELARKMAVDALDLSEEVKAEVEDEDGGVIAALYNEGTEKLDDLLLERYADQLEENGHKKRATLELIKEELQTNYEELRKPFHILSEEEVFQLLTNETKENFQSGILISSIIQRADNRYLLSVTQSGVICNLSRSSIFPYGDQTSLTAKFSIGQAIQSVIKSVDYSNFRCELSMLKEDMNKAVIKRFAKNEGTWDFKAERDDKQSEVQKEEQEERNKRVIKHPLFRNFDSRQAEAYLAGRSNGDYVIRPSSKGPDHITVTWKIDNLLYQHIDVIELDKPNEYSIGRTLQVGEFKYHDLDELIVSHVEQIHNKVEEMINHEKFRKGGLQEVKEWLTRYSEANKSRSYYTFCYNHKSPGWFFLLFKLNPQSSIVTWNVKAIPTGFFFSGNVYPDMTSLCNGFKTVVANKRNHRGQQPQQQHQQSYQQPPQSQSQYNQSRGGNYYNGGGYNDVYNYGR